MIALAITLVVIALVGAPLFIVIAAAGLLTSFNTDISPDILIIEMNRLAASPNMISISLFTFAGVMMSHGGAPVRLVNFYRAALGWMPGGLAIVTIGTCAFLLHSLVLRVSLYWPWADCFIQYSKVKVIKRISHWACSPHRAR